MPTDKKEGAVTKRQRAMNQQARELGMPVPFPKIVKEKPKPKPISNDMKQGFKKR